jgi:hypothetical protein
VLHASNLRRPWSDHIESCGIVRGATRLGVVGVGIGMSQADGIPILKTAGVNSDRAEQPDHG